MVQTENLHKIIKNRDTCIEAIALLQAYADYGLPNNYSDKGIELCHNSSSGWVFLTNEDYQTFILCEDNDTLVAHLYTPYAGYEGTIDELVAGIDEEDDIEDIEFLLEHATQDWHKEKLKELKLIKLIEGN